MVYRKRQLKHERHVGHIYFWIFLELIKAKNFTYFKKQLIVDGKNELASIIVDIQRNEEELLVVRFLSIL